MIITGIFPLFLVVKTSGKCRSSGIGAAGVGCLGRSRPPSSSHSLRSAPPQSPSLSCTRGRKSSAARSRRCRSHPALLSALTVQYTGEQQVGSPVITTRYSPSDNYHSGRRRTRVITSRSSPLMRGQILLTCQRREYFW